MQLCSKIITVSEDDLDELNHVNNVRYVQWVQDIAKEHWLQNASDSILKSNFWVLISHLIEYKSPALLGDEIRLETYVSKSEGFRSIRMVEIFHNKTNRLLVKSETNWCFMNRNTKKPARITEEISSLFN